MAAAAGVTARSPAFWSQALTSQSAASAAGCVPPITKPKKRPDGIAVSPGSHAVASWSMTSAGSVRPVGQLGAEPLDDLLDLCLRRDRALVERVQPALGVLAATGRAEVRSVTLGTEPLAAFTGRVLRPQRAPARASLSARRTLRASARPPRRGERATTPAVISQGLARTSAFSPYRRWIVKRLRYM